MSAYPHVFFHNFLFISTVFIEFMNIQSIFYITYHKVKVPWHCITLKSSVVP